MPLGVENQQNQTEGSSVLIKDINFMNFREEEREREITHARKNENFIFLTPIQIFYINIIKALIGFSLKYWTNQTNNQTMQ